MGGEMREVQMRTMKFRAYSNWKKGHMEYFTLHDRDWAMTGGGYPIMQYTGLQDKNGVCIYEGHIYTYSVFTGPENGKYECGYGPMVVEYRESICTETGNFLGIGFTIFSEHRGGIEVIGNIYENPELLEEK
jgi:uncharacterized phage protein (TIGR01671 family)